MKPIHLDTGMPSDCQRKLDNSELLLKTSNLVQKDMSESSLENSLRLQSMEGDLQDTNNTVMQTEAIKNSAPHSDSTLSNLSMEDQKALIGALIDVSKMNQNNVKLQPMPGEISELNANVLVTRSPNEVFPNQPPQVDQSLLRTALSEPMNSEIKPENDFSMPSSQHDCLILNGDLSNSGQTIETNFQSPTHGQIPASAIESLSPVINPMQKEPTNAQRSLQDMLNSISPTVSNTGTGVTTPNHEFLIQPPIQREQPEMTLMQQVEKSYAERDKYCEIEFRQPRPPDLPPLTRQHEFIQPNTSQEGFIQPISQNNFQEPTEQSFSSPTGQGSFPITTNQDGFLQQTAFNQVSNQDQESFMQTTTQASFVPSVNEGDLVTINPGTFLQATIPSTFSEASNQSSYHENEDQSGFMSIGGQSTGQDLNSIGATFQEGQQNFSNSLFPLTSAQPILADLNHSSINMGISSSGNVHNTGIRVTPLSITDSLFSGGSIMSEAAHDQGFVGQLNSDNQKMDNTETASSSAEFPEKVHHSPSGENAMLTSVPQNTEEHAMPSTDQLPSFGTNIPNHLLMTDFSGVNLHAFHELDSPNSLASPSFGSQLNGALSPPQNLLRNQLLSDDIDLGPSSPSSVSSVDHYPSSPTPISSPGLDTSTNTQMTLINRSKELCLDNDTFSSTTDGSMSKDMEPNLWQMADERAMDCMIFADRGPFTSLSMKVPSTLNSLNMTQMPPVTVKIEEQVFKIPDTDRPVGLLALAESAEARSNENTVEKIREKPAERCKSVRNTSRRSREATLIMQFPSKVNGYELRISEQPEEQHRARYLTEGSRGTVKDKSGNGFPVVKLLGFSNPATLQVFVGNDSGRVKPHGFYQACKVCGKNSTACNEETIDGTKVIEIPLTPANDMTSRIDCVGILKLRNADVEQRIGVAKSKKKSTKTRLVFRVTFQKVDGNHVTLQVPSSQILCTQPVGVPEICRMSLDECSVEGGKELFIIGKNLKSSKVFLQECTINGEPLWEKEAQIDTDFLHTTHLICTVPEYNNKRICEAVVVQIIVRCGGKVSEPMQFKYTPIRMAVKQEIPMETDCVHKATTFTAAPDALKLNEMIQQMPQSAIFQLPAGALPTPITNSVDMVTESVLNNPPTIQSSPFADGANIFSTPLVTTNPTEPNYLRTLLIADTNQNS